MGSFFTSTLRSLRAVALLGFLASSAQSVAHAGLISYTSGSGGTFDPSTPSTFTFTNFGQGTLSNSVNYNRVAVLARWNGATPYPGAFDISSLSVSNPGSSALGNISFLAGTAADTFVNNSNAYVSLNSVVTTSNFGAIQLTLTIPALTVSDGWKLDFKLGFSDGLFNSNTTSFQTVTAVNAAVPEIDPTTGSIALSLVSGLLALLEQRRRKRPAVATVAMPAVS